MNAVSTSAVVPGNRPSHDPLSLRSRVVEILAGTANGCLTELGYYPGMPQRLQELERQNAKWQSENVKLFQDNRSLTRALQEQNDSKYLNTIRTLESQVQGLSHEKARLVQQNETLLAVQPTAYQKLASAHQRLQDFYTAALHEISRLRYDIDVLSGRAPAQQAYATQVVRQEAVQGSSVFPSRQSPQVPQTLQSQIPFLSSQEPPVVPSFIANGASIVPSQQPGREIVEEQVHVKVQTPFGSDAQHALSLVSDWRRHNPITHAEHPNSRSNSRISQSRSVSRPGSSVGTSSRASLQPTFLVKTSPVPPEMGSSHLPFTSMNPVLSQRHSVPPPEPKFSANTEPLPNPMGTIDVPEAAPPPAIPPSLVFLPAQLHSNTTTSSLSGALTQRDINVKPSTSTHCEVPRESELTFEQIHVDSDHSHASVSPAEPIEAMTPMDVTTEVSPVISLAASSTLERESLKRTSSAMSVTDEEQQHKKQRLDRQKQSDHEEKRTTGTDDDVIDIDRDEDEGSEDGGVEIGPDGLRLVEDCIAALLEDDEDNEELQTCKLCIMRFKLGASTDEPKPFLRATTEELVRHYTSEHSAAWDKIRRNTYAASLMISLHLLLYAKWLTGSLSLLELRSTSPLSLPWTTLYLGNLSWSFRVQYSWVASYNPSCSAFSSPKVSNTGLIIEMTRCASGFSLLRSSLFACFKHSSKIINPGGRQLARKNGNIQWTDLLLNGLLSTLCEAFFIRRCWKMTNKSRWVLYPLATLLASVMAANAYLVAIAMALAFRSLEAGATYESLNASRNILSSTVVAFSYWIFGSLILDVVFTSILVTCLWRLKTGMAELDKILMHIIRMTVESSALSSICMIVAVGLYHASPHLQDHLILFFVLLTGKLYAIGMLHTLNSRAKLRQRMESHDPSRMALADWNWDKARVPDSLPSRPAMPTEPPLAFNVSDIRCSISSASIQMLGDTNAPERGPRDYLLSAVSGSEITRLEGELGNRRA